MMNRRFGMRGGGILSWAIPALLAFLLLASCGYRFDTVGGKGGRGLHNVFVEPFTNGTSEAKVENIFRSAFIDQFVRTVGYRLVEKRQQADVILSGHITGLSTAPLSYRKDKLAAEERLTVWLEVVFQRGDSQQVIWADRNFSGSEVYALEGTDPTLVRELRRQALVKMASEIAERAYRRMTSGF
jgi:hypothetical protein